VNSVDRRKEQQAGWIVLLILSILFILSESGRGQPRR